MPVRRCAYRFALRPTATQRTALERSAHARRFAYNWGLTRWRRYHDQTGGTIPLAQLMREMTKLKREQGLEWLQDVDSQLMQQAILDLRQAYRNFFERRARYPRFKSRKRDPLRFRIPQRVRLSGSWIYVPKIGWIRVRLSRQVTGETKSATFRRDAEGRWFVCLVSERQIPAVPRAWRNARAVGVDLGIIDFAVLSDGARIESPRFAQVARRRLRRAHRELSRKAPNGRNRAKARRRLAKAYRRTANQRQDFLHKLSTEIVRSWDVIAIEDLGVTGLARTKLASAMHDSALREFQRQLEYKAEWQAKKVVVVDRFYPSSRRCSECGAINAELRPRERRWSCGCGAIHDRDLNAAVNLRAVALNPEVAVGPTDTENACGAHV